MQRRRRNQRAHGVEVRPASPEDLHQLVELVERCTAETVYRRFHGSTGQALQRELARIASPSVTHRSWVAVDADGTIRGTATLAWSTTGIVEAAFLVEDAWFRRGIGRSLFTALAAEARRCELDAVMASIQADNHRAQRFLRAMAPGAHLAFAGGGLVDVTIPVVRHPRDQVAEARRAAAAVGASG